MRRGSRSPNMLQMSIEQRRSLQTDQPCDFEKPRAFADNKMRRLSIVSALRAQFELSTIMETDASNSLRRLPKAMEPSRNFTYELLSRVE